MPLPLLLIPMGIVAAASGTTVAALVGSLTGVVGGAGMVGVFWMHRVESAATSSAHEQSLKEHTSLIQQKIALSKTTVTSLHPPVVAVNESLSQRLADQKAADARYLEAVAELTHLKEALEVMTQKAAESQATMVVSQAELAQWMAQHTPHTTTVMQEQLDFQALLHAKQDALTQALQQLERVTQDLSAKAAEVTALQETLAPLQHALTMQQSVISSQQQAITRLERQLVTMSRLSFFAQQAPTPSTRIMNPVETIPAPH